MQEYFFEDGKVNAAAVHAKLLQQPLLPTLQWYSEDGLQKRQSFWNSSLLPENVAIKLLSMGEELLLKEPNVLELSQSVTIVGDIHGQFCDLLELLRKSEGLSGYEFVQPGRMLNSKYLFMGDYVDRGCYSCEVMLFLIALKLSYPDKVFLLRGNHETRSQTMRPMKQTDENGKRLPEELTGIHYKREAEIKYGKNFYKHSVQCFDALPLACLLTHRNNRFLCIHGGLSPALKSLDDLRKINRFHEPELTGIFCDILWSDPVSQDMEDEAWEGDRFSQFEFAQNWDRGGGQFFGMAATKHFLKENNLDGIIRAHQMEDGVFYHYRDPEFKYPMVTTVFSASNYCGQDENRAAVIQFSEKEMLTLLLDPVLPDAIKASESPQRKISRRNSIITDFGKDIENDQLESSSESMHHLGEKARSQIAESHASWRSLRKITGQTYSRDLLLLSQLNLDENFSNNDSSTESHPGPDATDIMQLRCLFDVIDQNEDQSLTIDELRGFLKSLSNEIDEASANSIFERMDEDHSGNISFPEFVAFFTTLKFKREKAMQTAS